MAEIFPTPLELLRRMKLKQNPPGPRSILLDRRGGGDSVKRVQIPFWLSIGSLRFGTYRAVFCIRSETEIDLDNPVWAGMYIITPCNDIRHNRDFYSNVCVGQIAQARLDNNEITPDEAFWMSGSAGAGWYSEGSVLSVLERVSRLRPK